MATAVQDLVTPVEGIRVPAWRHVAFAVSVALLALVTPLVRSYNPGEFAVDMDEAYHATTGAYFADFYADRPLAHPIDYTYRYYAKYPALGLVHWPPFFHIVEGALFHVFGASAQTGRLTVRLFVLFGLLYFYWLIEMLQNRRAAIVATMLLALMPGLIPLENAVMVDWPALALCIAASFYWLRWLRDKSGADLWAFAAFGVLALLTKQQSCYLAVFCLLTLLVGRQWQSKSLWKVVALIGAASVPFYLTAVARHGGSILHHLVGSHAPDYKSISFYIVKLPSQVGWWVLPFVLIGIVLALMHARGAAIPMLLWIAACYLSFAFLNAREPRYNIYCIPPLLYFAAVPFTTQFKRRWETVAGMALAVALICGYTAQAWAAPPPFADGTAAAAQRVLDANIPGRPVLFDGSMSGDFIFYMRALDPSRNSIVLRKSLYATNILRQFGAEQLVNDQADLQSFLDEYGVHIIVVAENDPLHFPIQAMLRRYLQTPRFRLIARIHIESNRPLLQGTVLQVYENLDTKAPAAHSLNLRMITLDHDISVPMDDLGSHP